MQNITTTWNQNPQCLFLLDKPDNKVGLSKFCGIFFYNFYIVILLYYLFFFIAILENADLAKTTSKKVRLDVEKKLNCDLVDRKGEIDKIVMNYIDTKVSVEESDDEEEDEKDEKDDVKSEKSDESEVETKRPQRAGKKRPAPKTKKSPTVKKVR